MCAAEQHTCCPFSSFTIITVACLGLFGPSAFVIDQKTKEIVDRKVLGATVTQILPLISKEFLILVFLSFAISIPFTWWVITTWLQSFAYRIQIGAWAFPLAGLPVITIAILTVSIQVIKPALSNPVRSMRTE